MELKNLCSIKLPNGNRLLVDPSKKMIEAMIFGIYGIRSKGRAVIVNADYLLYYSLQEQFNLGSFEEKIGGCDYVFFVYTPQADANRIKIAFRKSMAVVKSIGNFKGILVNYETFKNNTFSEKEYEIISSYYSYILKDNDFQIAHINGLKSLTSYKAQLTSLEENLRKYTDHRDVLKKQMETSFEDNVDKINKVISNLTWIEGVAQHGSGMIVKTKPLQMSLVPNIGKSLDPDMMSTNAFLYTIFKNQCLGLNFVSPSCQYLVPYDMNVKNNENTGEDTRIKKHLRNFVMFHGMNPHIGPSGNCYGEFASAISSSQKIGLDFLLMSLEAYLRSANLQDSAGKEIVAYPMGTEDGRITSWPYMDAILNRCGVTYRGERTEKVYEKLLGLPNVIEAFNRSGNGFNRPGPKFQLPTKSRLEANLQLIKNREPKIYEKIMKRIEEGAIL